MTLGMREDTIVVGTVDAILAWRLHGMHEDAVHSGALLSVSTNGLGHGMSEPTFGVGAVVVELALLQSLA